jgi:hypothetical protein
MAYLFILITLAGLYLLLGKNALLFCIFVPAALVIPPIVIYFLPPIVFIVIGVGLASVIVYQIIYKLFLMKHDRTLKQMCLHSLFPELFD